MNSGVPLFAVLIAACSSLPSSEPQRGLEPVVLTDDGGWCWFQDPRALVVEGRIVVGSVASGRHDPERRGDVQVTTWDPESGVRATVELADRLELDDHDAPALHLRDDGRLLAVYSRHGTDDLVRWRISSAPGDALWWGPERQLELRGGRGVTYSNLHAVRDERGRRVLLDLLRGEGWDPNVLVSTDQGESWTPRGRLLGGPGRPYLRYASDGGVLHFVTTEQHPRDFDNSVFHGVLRGVAVLDSHGKVAGVLGGDPPAPEALTRVFTGAPDAVHWTADLELDGSGHPVLLATVQKDGAGLPPGSGGEDHRFAYARFDGERWHAHEIGHAGSRLYAGEDDYTGLGAIDPDDVDVVYVSTDVHPALGTPLVSAADGRRHRELWVGRTRDLGASWEWTALTEDSGADQLRPTVPAWPGSGRTALLWLRGTLRSYTDYDLELVGLVLEDSGADVKPMETTR